jgi:hypothetical protein
MLAARQMSKLAIAISATIAFPQKPDDVARFVIVAPRAAEWHSHSRGSGAKKMAFIFRRRATSKRQHGAELDQEGPSRLLWSPDDRVYSLPRTSGGEGVSAISVIVALLILIAVVGLMLLSGI